VRAVFENIYTKSPPRRGSCHGRLRHRIRFTGRSSRDAEASYRLTYNPDHPRVFSVPIEPELSSSFSFRRIFVARHETHPLENALGGRSMSSGNDNSQPWLACVLFLILVVVFAGIIYACRAFLPSGTTLSVFTWTPRAADGIQMWSVGLAGLVTVVSVEGSLRSIGFEIAPPKYFLIAAALPPAYCAVIYVPAWLLGLGSFQGSSVLLHGIAASVANLPLAVFFALGEEIGWRGVLAPKLAQIVCPVWAGLLSGVVWAVWHWLDILYFGYNVNTLPIYAIACFSISLAGLSVFLTWLRLSSRSIWPCALFHGAHNAVIHRIFERATEADQVTPYITTEFGIGFAVVSGVIGLISWRLLRRSRQVA
jgi:uncharacterized protein